MKVVSTLIALITATICLGQTDSASNVIFFDDFTDNTNKWTIADDKNVRSKIEGGIYYLTATGHAYGEAQDIKINTRKDFQIEARIKIVNGNTEHKDYYSMLFWGREAMNGYYFTFAGDGFTSLQLCTGKNQNSCVTKKGSLQKAVLAPEQFNVYTIRKTGNSYVFLINGEAFYTMPFTPFYGNLIGLGAGRKVSLAIDYIKIMYL